MSEFEKWNSGRMEELTARRGWLSLIGLHWLEEGINTFGSGTDNTIVFPKEFPIETGSFIVTGDRIEVILSDTTIMVDGKNPVGLISVNTDNDEQATQFRSGRFEWIVIRRGGSFGIRMWDTESSKPGGFGQIPRYEISPDWIVKAEVELLESESMIIDNEVGMKLKMSIPAILKFEIGGKEYSLKALEGGDDQWFMIFSDNTTGVSTYGSGRYLYVDIPKEGSIATVDFNKSYNPPCAFTEYATCLLPPTENHLNLEVKSGEKYK